MIGPETEIAAALSRVRRAASFALDTRGRRLGTYRAAVEAVREADAIRWDERGSTRPAGRTRRLPARNAQRWRLAHGALILEHARDAAPVVIARFPLAALGEGWTLTAEPHRCDRDLYLGAVRFSPRGIELDWTIRTAAGDQRLRARYRARYRD